MDNHCLSMVLAYILLVLCTQSAVSNGHMRKIQIRICKSLLTRCTARPGMLCDRTHPCLFFCVCFTYHSYAMLKLLVAGLSPRRSGFDPVAVVLGFVVDSTGITSRVMYFVFPLLLSIVLHTRVPFLAM